MFGTLLGNSRNQPFTAQAVPVAILAGRSLLAADDVYQKLPRGVCI